MKTSTKILSSLMFALTLNACSNGTSNSAQAVPSKPDVRVNDNSTTVDFDYGQLMYKHDGTCARQDINDRFVSVHEIKIGTATDGKEVYAQADLLIYPDGTYRAEYQEEDLLYRTETKYGYKRYRIRNLTGSWYVKDGKLVLDNLGILQGRMEDNKIVAEFTYQQDIVSSGLSGKIAEASRVSSTSAITYGREICPASEDIPGKFASVMNQSHTVKTELKSLQALNPTVLSSGSILVTHMELFLETDGRYFLLIKLLDQNVPLGREKTYIVDDMVWERTFNTLDLYSGNLSFGNPGELVLDFDRDLQLVENEQIVGTLQTNGKSIRMKLQKSDYTMDDLTSVYADGGTPIYSH
ncbi:MAG TPA: hypothetical protein VF412_05365 [Bdellovibrio sp.]|uniref:hypothetical protein n=1 Tax=Bdellovibrio sp. TaxID=28201 RepID=UPI002EE32499